MYIEADKQSGRSAGRSERERKRERKRDIYRELGIIKVNLHAFCPVPEVRIPADLLVGGTGLCACSLVSFILVDYSADLVVGGTGLRA